MTMLRIIDPLGGEQRKRKKLKRWIYRSKVDVGEQAWFEEEAVFP